LPRALLAGYRRLASTARSIVMDWNPASMAEDLEWASRQEVLDAHVRRVAAHFAGYERVVLHLVAPMDVTTRRAWLERGDRWLHKYARLSTSSATAALDRAIEWHSRQGAGVDRCLRAYVASTTISANRRTPGSSDGPHRRMRPSPGRRRSARVPSRPR
jgi:hypothetical protein